jgi:hypothetical protein
VKGAKVAVAVDHVSTRLDETTVARLDALAPLLAPVGTKPARSIAVRACILTGLDVLESRLAKGAP